MDENTRKPGPWASLALCLTLLFGVMLAALLALGVVAILAAIAVPNFLGAMRAHAVGIQWTLLIQTILIYGVGVILVLIAVGVGINLLLGRRRPPDSQMDQSPGKLGHLWSTARRMEERMANLETILMHRKGDTDFWRKS